MIGGIPYDIILPVLERANPQQLYKLEHYNPYLLDDTDELWRRHCEKEFKKYPLEEMETWRDKYLVGTLRTCPISFFKTVDCYFPDSDVSK